MNDKWLRYFYNISVIIMSLGLIDLIATGGIDVYSLWIFSAVGAGAYLINK